MSKFLNILLDTSIEHTKALANEFCKVGTHVNICDDTGRILEYTFITLESKHSFLVKSGLVCPVDLMFRNKRSLNGLTEEQIEEYKERLK